MQSSRARLVLPLLIIVVGVGWLMTAQGVGTGIDWIWTLGLGVIGLLTFVVVPDSLQTQPPGTARSQSLAATIHLNQFALSVDGTALIGTIAVGGMHM